MLTFEPRPWDAEAQSALAQLLGHWLDEVRTGVQSGRMQLWRISGHSWAVTATDEDHLHVWAYQGCDAVTFCFDLCRACVLRGVRELTFFTYRPALARLLKPFRPAVEPDGEGFTVTLTLPRCSS